MKVYYELLLYQTAYLDTKLLSLQYKVHPSVEIEIYCTYTVFIFEYKYSVKIGIYETLDNKKYSGKTKTFKLFHHNKVLDYDHKRSISTSIYNKEP